VLGRGEECDISINHPSVSRVHAEIRRVGDGRYEFVDLGSANGVRVNGVELPSTLLDGRDVLELGDVFLKFLPAGEIFIAGAEETTRQYLSSAPRAMSNVAKIAIAATVVAVGVVVALALRTSEPPPAPIAQSTGGDKLAQTLKDARALLARGDTEGAMQKAGQIPENSNLRESADFKAIQDAWADALFDKALATQDVSEKRGFLDRIARATSVDPARRKRAADELDSIQRPAINVTDLPSDSTAAAPAPSVTPTATHATSAALAAVPEAPPAHKEAAPKQAAAPKPVVTTPKSSSPAAKKDRASSTLVRDNPFE